MHVLCCTCKVEISRDKGVRKKSNPPAISIFVMPPFHSMFHLFSLLRGRPFNSLSRVHAEQRRQRAHEEAAAPHCTARAAHATRRDERQRPRRKKPRRHTRTHSHISACITRWKQFVSRVTLEMGRARVRQECPLSKAGDCLRLARRRRGQRRDTRHAHARQADEHALARSGERTHTCDEHITLTRTSLSGCIARSLLAPAPSLSSEAPLSWRRPQPAPSTFVAARTDQHRHAMSAAVARMPIRAVATGLDLPKHEAELEAMAEGRATATTSVTASQPNSTQNGRRSQAALQEDADYITATLARLNHIHHERFQPGGCPVDATPAQHAHPRIRVHGVHGLDPAICSRAEIEAKLASIDAARKVDKHRQECASRGEVAPVRSQEESADESILKVLALRKLQLLQLHLKTDNQPIMIRAPTATQGGIFLGSVGASHHLPNLVSNNITHILSVGRNLAQPFPAHFRYLYIPMLDSSTTKITQDVYETSWAFIDEARRGGRDSAATPSPTAVAAVAPAPARSDDVKSSSPRPGMTRSSAVHPSAALASALARDEREEGSVLVSRVSPLGSAAAAAASRPGNVLIHCFAGKSRSTTILLSYLMFAERWSLDQAYAHVKKCRPAINVRSERSRRAAQHQSRQ